MLPGGAPCDGDFYETDECEATPCPVDCAVSEWEDYNECSKSCGGGIQVQNREVTTREAPKADLGFSNGGGQCTAS